MRRRSHTSYPIVVSRWNSWAERLIVRLSRFAAHLGATPLWRLPALSNSRSVVHGQNNFLYLSLQPRISLAINAGDIRNTAVRHLYSPHLSTLNLFASRGPVATRLEKDQVLPGTRTSLAMPSRAPKKSPDAYRSLPPLLPILESITRTRREYYETATQRRLLVNRQNETHEVVRRMTHSTQRRHELSEFAELGQPMSFRKTAPAIYSPKPAPNEVTTEFASLSGPNRLTTIPEMKLPAINVEEIASQVLKQIDRRVIARRERLGQV